MGRSQGLSSVATKETTQQRNAPARIVCHTLGAECGYPRDRRPNGSGLGPDRSGLAPDLSGNGPDLRVLAWSSAPWVGSAESAAWAGGEASEPDASSPSACPSALGYSSALAWLHEPAAWVLLLAAWVLLLARVGLRVLGCRSVLALAVLPLAWQALLVRRLGLA